jgi:rhodanese-related sulfurtransferase
MRRQPKNRARPFSGAHRVVIKQHLFGKAFASDRRASRPRLIDVRTKEDFAADPRFIPGAVRRAHATVSNWGSDFAGRSTVVVCENGQGLSEGVAAWLRQVGASSAEILVGGHSAWAQAGLPLIPENIAAA